jgi:hypothetical protein
MCRTTAPVPGTSKEVLPQLSTAIFWDGKVDSSFMM